MANKYRGEVEFTDSEGTKYVLRLGTNEYLRVQKEAEKVAGLEWQRFMLHQGLICGASTAGCESQKDLTLEQVGELIDDIGSLKADDLISLTRYGKNSLDAAKEYKKRREAEEQAGSANPPATPPSSSS